MNIDTFNEDKGFDSHVAPVTVQAFRNKRQPQTRQGGGDIEHGSSSGNKEGAHICFYHIRFGKAARRCQSWCLLNDGFRSQPKNFGPKGDQGNSTAGRH